MASRLNDIANKINEQERLKEEELERQKELVYKAKINSAREWIANTYAKNQSEMKDFEEEAKRGLHTKTIFKTNYKLSPNMGWYNDGHGYTPFGTIGTAPDKDLVPPYGLAELSEKDRFELETYGCELVKKMFSEANKKNNWGFTMSDTCQGKVNESKDVRVYWL